MNDFFFDAFPNPTVFKNFVKSLVFTKSPYPFYFNRNGTILMEEVDVYLSPDLYNNNKSFLKNINETGEAAIDSNALSHIRVDP